MTLLQQLVEQARRQNNAYNRALFEAFSGDPAVFRGRPPTNEPRGPAIFYRVNDGPVQSTPLLSRERT